MDLILKCNRCFDVNTTLGTSCLVTRYGRFVAMSDSGFRGGDRVPLPQRSKDKRHKLTKAAICLLKQISALSYHWLSMLPDFHAVRVFIETSN